MKKLDPKSLEVFLAVMESGSATLAGERLGMTQPAITKAIAGLEARTGLTLFERGRFGMRPTAEGALLAEEVRRSFAGLDRVAVAAQAIRQGMRGNLVVSALPIYAEGLVARAVGALAAEAPELTIRVETHLQDETFRRILLDKADIGVVSGPFVPNGQLQVHPVGQRRMMALMQDSHPLANRSELGVADLLDVEVVLVSSPSPYRETVLQAFARHGAPVRSRLEVLSQRGTAAMALASGQLALIDQELAEEIAFKDPGVHIADFTDAPPWQIAVVHHREKPLNLVAEAVLHRLKLAAADFRGEAP